MIDKGLIQNLIPHAGAMCLLELVVAWDEESILCRTETHRDRANPLRRDGRLAMVHVAEYGGQAVALHGALRARQAGQSASPGYLAALRDLRWERDFLDDIAAPLEIAAQRLFGEDAHCIYTIQARAAGRHLAEARLTIAPQPVEGEAQR